jgi:hypothetical protein
MTLDDDLGLCIKVAGKTHVKIGFHKQSDGIAYELIGEIPNIYEFHTIADKTYFVSKETSRTLKQMNSDEKDYIKVLIFGRSLKVLEKQFQFDFEEQK